MTDPFLDEFVREMEGDLIWMRIAMFFSLVVPCCTYALLLEHKISHKLCKYEESFFKMNHMLR